MEMSLGETLSLLTSVIFSPEVIGAAVVILFILNMVFYTSSYKKRRRRRKLKKRFRAAAFSYPRLSIFSSTKNE